MNGKTGLIIGVGTLADYLNVSRPTVYRYLRAGLPGYYVQADAAKRGTWHFHIENVEAFFKKLTAIKMKTISEDMFEEDESIIVKKPSKNGDKKPCQEKSM
jgi:predicted transcriptional regulator